MKALRAHQPTAQRTSPTVNKRFTTMPFSDTIQATRRRGRLLGATLSILIITSGLNAYSDHHDTGHCHDDAARPSCLRPAGPPPPPRPGHHRLERWDPWSETAGERRPGRHTACTTICALGTGKGDRAYKTLKAAGFLPHSHARSLQGAHARSLQGSLQGALPRSLQGALPRSLQGASFGLSDSTRDQGPYSDAIQGTRADP